MSNPNSSYSVRDNDMKPGALQLKEGIYQFFENVGTVQIPVVRVGGSDGQVRVFYRTAPKTALTGTDFVFSNGEIVFREGEAEKFIEIQILDDKVREETKSFVIELLNPQAAEGVVNFRGFGQRPMAEVYILDDDSQEVLNFRGLGSRFTAAMTIQDDDTTPGILEFDRAAYFVQENEGLMQVVVVRKDGSDGQIRCQYQTRPKSAVPGSDFAPVQGELVFEHGETTKVIPIQILEDSIRETTESFEIVLMELNQGRQRVLGQIQTTEVVISDNDRNPGFLELEEPTYVVSEGIRTLHVVVKRKGGSDGRDGETEKTIDIRIFNDMIKESIKSFEVQLLDPLPAPGIVNFRVIGSRMKTLITIADDDTNPGLVQMARPVYDFRETDGIVNIPVMRVNGSDGQIQVRYQTVSRTAKEGIDFRPLSGELIFQDGEIEKTIPLQILNDREKEPTESFEVRLLDPTPGPGVLNFGGLGFNTYSVIKILDDDNPGKFEFRETRTSVHEGSGRVTLTILRTDGSDGFVSLQLRAIDGSARQEQDYRLRSTTINFSNGETEKTVDIVIIDDNIREGDEHFKVGLFDPSNSAIIGQKKRPSIPASQGPFIYFPETSVTVPLESPVVYFNIRREGNDWEKLNLFMETLDGTARENVHYKKTKGNVTFELNDMELRMSANLIDNPNRAGKSFKLRLYDPERGVILRGREILTCKHSATSNTNSRTAIFKPTLPGSGQSSFPALPPPQRQRRKPPQGQEDCEPGLIFKSCFFGCPEVCNWIADPICSKSCTPACVCPSGLILESLHSSKCVPRSQCPNSGGRGTGIVGGGGGLLGGGGGGLVGGLLGGGGGLNVGTSVGVSGSVRTGGIVSSGGGGGGSLLGGLGLLGGGGGGIKVGTNVGVSGGGRAGGIVSSGGGVKVGTSVGVGGGLVGGLLG
ncbi:Adhesion G-protein coupled receptor V1 like protein [Argiope bruennichi]|uniref:Adhesion G-protein coupled receptor V1 like protein n=1 Tax=Argiope bruennichi TaxID=94029 RepID=A0A8T0EAD7_ARGBR|nr:Adhesion G-protein coupled receptor V1 like protein [Argiope bruennichi]